MLLLPYKNATLDIKSLRIAVNVAVDSEFLRNYLFQKYLEINEPVIKFSFGMLPEDTGRVSYYNIGVEFENV